MQDNDTQVGKSNLPCIPVGFEGMELGEITGFRGVSLSEDGESQEQITIPMKKGKQVYGAILLFSQYTGPENPPYPLPPIVLNRKGFNELLQEMLRMDERFASLESGLVHAEKEEEVQDAK